MRVENYPNAIITITHHASEPEGAGQAVNVGAKADPLHASGYMEFPSTQLSFSKLFRFFLGYLSQ